MVNPVRQVVSGQLQQFGKGVIKGLFGRSGSKGRGSDNSPTGILDKKTKFTTTNISYPSGVESPDQGHWILFQINSNMPPKLAKGVGNNEKNLKKIRDQAHKEFKLKGIKGRTLSGRANLVFEQNGRDVFNASAVGGGEAKLKGAPTTSAISRPPSAKKSTTSTNLYAASGNVTRLDTTIALYMPAQVQASYSLSYSDVEIGAFGQALVGVFDSIVKVADGTPISKAGFEGPLANAEEGVKRMALGSIDAVMPGIRAQAQIKEGKILSNKMELSFTGVNRRSFQFSFVFLPKSEDEAKTVEHIVHLFKYHSHPDFVPDKAGRQMTIPDSFDITYMHQNGPNSFLNQISTCFLESINVSYGGDRFVAYRPTEGLFGAGAPPQRITMALTFKEMEIITRERIRQGF